MPRLLIAPKSIIEDEGLQISANPVFIDFVGAGVTVTEPTPGNVQVSIPGAAPATPLVVQDEGITEDANVSLINFTGAGVTASQTAPGQVDVNIPGAAGTGLANVVTIGPAGSGADYETDGVADEVQFIAARDDAKIGGTAGSGTILVLNSVYNFSADTTFNFGSNIRWIGTSAARPVINFNFSGANTILGSGWMQSLRVNNVGAGVATFQVNLGRQAHLADFELGPNVIVPSFTNVALIDSVITSTEAFSLGSNTYYLNCAITSSITATFGNNERFVACSIIRGNISGGSQARFTDCVLTLLDIQNGLGVNFAGALRFVNCSIPSVNAANWASVSVRGIVFEGGLITPAISAANWQGKRVTNLDPTKNQNLRIASPAGAAFQLNLELADNFDITLDQNVTLSVASLYIGARIIVIVRQDGAGGHTVTWPGTTQWAGGVAPTVTAAANAKDVFELVWNGTNLHGTILGQNYS